MGKDLVWVRVVFKFGIDTVFFARNTGNCSARGDRVQPAVHSALRYYVVVSRDLHRYRDLSSPAEVYLPE